MPVSIDSQLATLRRVVLLRPTDLARAGLSLRASEAEMLHLHLKALLATFEFVAGDERIRRYIETNGPKS